MLQCIYSLSRRMGRPMPKNQGGVADSSGRQTNLGPLGDDDNANITPSSPTPASTVGCAALNLTTAAAEAGAEAAAIPTSLQRDGWNDGEVYAVPDELSQRPLPWSSPNLLAGDEPELAPYPVVSYVPSSRGGTIATSGESRRHSVADPLHFDDLSRYFELDMPSLLQAMSCSFASQRPISASVYENWFGSSMHPFPTIPTTMVANQEQDLPRFSDEAHRPPPGSEQRQNISSGSDQLLETAAPVQQDEIIPSIQAESDQMVDDLALSYSASDMTWMDGEDRPSLRQGTRLSQVSSPSYLGIRWDAGALPLSSPDTATATLSQLSMTYGFGGGFLGEKAANGEDEDGEGPFIISSSSPASADRPHPRSLNEQEPSISVAGGHEGRGGGGNGGGYCECVSTVSRCIVSLWTAKQKQHGRSQPLALDSVLRMDSEVAASLSRLHQCRACRCESTVHLLALISLRMMVHLLQTLVWDEFASYEQPERGSPDDSQNSGIGEGRRGALWIGEDEVSPCARLWFLGRLLQERFHRLAVLIEERKNFMGTFARDCLAGASLLLLEDISQDLQTMVGLLELWNPES
ncbi:hypothetical protein N657DRAFT_644942 [Parathielavia appendiculata]|uniref:Uncharacterized protein n=1 Tax=Parathielavia appendiculata TaxID=2587402 RepID=A0AAN6Z3X5_9PEZI|nr:hypothetical protein N657DRAFT_644942 [Parathielavia appendiculata]